MFDNYQICYLGASSQKNWSNLRSEKLNPFPQWLVVAHLLSCAVLVPVSTYPALQPLSMYVQSTRGRARHKMWLLALTLISLLSVHAIDIANEFVDEDADAVVVEGGITSLPFLSFNQYSKNCQSM